MTRLEIEIIIPLTDWEIEYIFDCWVAFVTSDLGYKASDLQMIYID